MSVDGNTTWSFGDGDYGKLGLGNSTAKATPTKVEALLGLGVKKVECGTQFTVALTRDGKVFTWGQGTYCCDDRAHVHCMQSHCVLQQFDMSICHDSDELCHNG